jgi:hypothetical protein
VVRLLLRCGVRLLLLLCGVWLLLLLHIVVIFEKK